LSALFFLTGLTLLAAAFAVAGGAVGDPDMTASGA
jgi:hypothetical protein